MLAGLIGALGGAVLTMVSMPSALFGRVPALSGMVNADSSDVAVVDGSTLRLRDAVIRLSGIQAPARGGRCLATDAAQDCGMASAQSLASLVRGHPVNCRLAGRDLSGFPEGRCDSAGTDLNLAQVAAGWARAHGDASDLLAAEANARDRRLGLWSGASATPAF